MAPDGADTETGAGEGVGEAGPASGDGLLLPLRRCSRNGPGFGPGRGRGDLDLDLDLELDLVPLVSIMDLDPGVQWERMMISDIYLYFLKMAT